MSQNMIAVRIPESQDIDDDERLKRMNNNLWIMPHDNNNDNDYRSHPMVGNHHEPSMSGTKFILKSNESKNDSEIIQRVSSPTLVTYNPENKLSQNIRVEESEDDSYEELYEGNNQMVYFRYDDKFSRKIYDFNSRPDLVVGLQTYARRHLARRALKRRKTEEEAILIIQSNIDWHMNPWMKLYRTIKPLLKFHKTDRYISCLKSKIAILKETVKALKMENSSFTEKLNGITQTLMRAHGSADEKQILQKNLNELNQEILSNANNFGNLLEKNNRKLDEFCMGVFPPFGITDDSDNELNLEENTFASETETFSISQEVAGDSGIMLRKKKHTFMAPFASVHQRELRSSSLGKARDDAEFYRMQVELLREEAECQHQSANSHYEEKIIVLSQRIEQLQNQLTEEINKNYKLKKDLDESLLLLNESKLCENSLKSIVDKLCKQLEDYRDMPKEFSDGPEGKEVIDRETYHKLIYCKEYIENLRNYYKTNPKDLQNTVLAPGAAFDIFEDWFLQKMPSASSSSAAIKAATAQCGNLINSQKKRPTNFPELLTPTIQNSNAMSPVIMFDQNVQRKHEEDIAKLEKQYEEERLEKESLEIEINELRQKINVNRRENSRLQEDHQEELNELRIKHQKRILELEELIEEESRMKQNFENQAKSLEKQLISMKRASEYSELEHVNDERQEIERRLREDVMYYKNSFDRVQEDFEDFKTRNDPHKYRIEIDERDEKITLLTHEKSQLIKELEIVTIKMQTNYGFLVDNENRLKQINKEKNVLLNRIIQLESERDSAVKEAAIYAGKAGADKETVAARSREIDELKSQREILKREISELKKDFDANKFDSNTEIQSLNMRIREADRDYELTKNNLEKDLETKNYHLQSIQSELNILVSNEKHNKTTIRQLRRKVADLEEEQVKHLKKISELERSYNDASEERDRAKSDFTAARETAEFLRASRTRLDEEVYELLGDQGVPYRRMLSKTPTSTSSNDISAPFKRNSLCTTIPDENDLPTPIPENRFKL